MSNTETSERSWLARSIVAQATKLFGQLNALDSDERMEVINDLRLAIHAHSPMRDQPVDCVLWVKQDEVVANDYNPNAVAPPEMRLLQKSIEEDGFTQPVVTWRDADTGTREIVDGFHRSLVARTPTMQKRVRGRLPITVVNANRTDRPNRMASTIRHNRARGEHSIPLMQRIVADLVESGMSDAWIMRHIGMDADELLRLKQLTGLAALFRQGEFSRAREMGA